MPHRRIMSESAQAAILSAMVLVGLLLLYEGWRRARRADSVTPGQFRRRMAGGLLLELDLLLWLVADLVTRGWKPAAQLLYMFGALLLVFVPIYLAIREAGFVVRQYARSRSDLVRNLGRRTGGAGGNGRDGPA
jgi:hypothetical protein